MDLLEEYIKSGRIKLNTHKYHETYTVHDPCNYVRKSQLAFGQSTADQSRWIAQQCMPYDEERWAYGSMKADQIRNTGAEIVIAPCHNCRDQIMKDLPKHCDMGSNYKETLYLWELVSLCLDFEPWSEAEIEAGHAARDAQFERDGVELDEEE
jgi:hypothetical protein